MRVPARVSVRVCRCVCRRVGRHVRVPARVSVRVCILESWLFSALRLLFPLDLLEHEASLATVMVTEQLDSAFTDPGCAQPRGIKYHPSSDEKQSDAGSVVWSPYSFG